MYDDEPAHDAAGWTSDHAEETAQSRSAHLEFKQGDDPRYIFFPIHWTKNSEEMTTLFKRLLIGMRGNGGEDF